MRPRILGLAFAAIPIGIAACGSTAPPPPGSPPPARLAPDSAAPEEHATVVRFETKEWTFPELFERIHRTTGISVLFDATDSFVQTRISLRFGPHTIAVDDLFDFVQSLLSYRGLVLVPVGPRNVDGRPQWCVSDPWSRPRPVFVDAKEVGKYADRPGLFIVTSIALSSTTDAIRMRNALSPPLTAAGGAGRIAEIPGERALVVGDFAPVVAEVVRRAALLEQEFAEAAPSDADRR